jgi:hypothetical protein
MNGPTVNDGCLNSCAHALLGVPPACAQTAWYLMHTAVLCFPWSGGVFMLDL